MSSIRKKESLEKADGKSCLKDGSKGSVNVKKDAGDSRRSILEKATKPKRTTTVSKERIKSDGRKSEKDFSSSGKTYVVRTAENDGKRGKRVGEKSERTLGKDVADERRKGSKADLGCFDDSSGKKKMSRGDGSGDVEEKKRKTEEGKRKRFETVGKTDEEKPKVRRERTRTRTLSPTEIKQLIPAKMAAEERPKEVVPGDAEKEADDETETEGGNEEYEEDFEDYESDFEQDESSEVGAMEIKEEKGLGQEPETGDESLCLETVCARTPENDTPKSREPEPETGKLGRERERWKLNVEKRQVEEVRKSIEKENMDLTEKRKSEPILTERGNSDGDEERIRRRTKGSIHISTASTTDRQEKEADAARKRGEELLAMISLDAITYAIMEIPPVPYETYMETFGKTNSRQVHVQTNEDDLDEEIQTDEISTCNRWTQNPPEYLGGRKSGSEVRYALTKEERLGAGKDGRGKEDDVGGEEEDEEEVVANSKTNDLIDFLSRSSQVVLAALERRCGNVLNVETMPNQSKSMSFGDGFVSMNPQDVSFLSEKSVVRVCLSRDNRNMLSVHVKKNKYFQRSFVCVWSLRELSKPLKVLVASNRVTSSCFGPDQGNLVFAGLSDGSICLWDLREPSACHNQTVDDPVWILRSPTFTTAGNLNETEPLSDVVSVQMLSKNEKFGGFENFTPLQVCSLDRNGNLTVWSVIQIEKVHRNEPSEDLGLAPWGRLKLVKSSHFCVFQNLRNEIPGLYITCNDLLINELADDGFYVANSFGSVQHCSTYGSPMKPEFFVPPKGNSVIIETTCLELCPFDGSYFLAGCRDGSIRLHSRHQPYPLITLNLDSDENERDAPVLSLSWMRSRPCAFFALHSRSRICVWDLSVSDMYPEMNLDLGEKGITCAKLLAGSDVKQVPFLVIGTEGGSIEIHRLKKEYGCRSASEMASEMKMFMRYVSIL